MPTANSKYTNKADSLRIGDWNSLFWTKSQKKYMLNVKIIRKLDYEYILCLQNIHNVI